MKFLYIKKRARLIDDLKDQSAAIQQKIRKQDGSLSRTEQEYEEEEKDRRLMGDKIRLHLFQSALLFGPHEKVHEASIRLQNLEYEQKPHDSNAHPMYLIDEGFIRTSFSAAMPGCFSYLPQRLLNVNSIEEGSLYLPAAEHISSEEFPLMLRSEHGSPFPINHIKGGGAVFQILLGRTGKGKSALVSEHIRAHMRLEECQGIETGVVVLDLGGSMSWLSEEDGVLSFEIRASKEGWEPLPAHPLQILLSQGRLNIARDFLVKLMQIKRHVPTAEDLITKAIKLSIRDKDYSFSGFYEHLTREVEAHKQEIELSSEMQLEWNNRLAILRKFKKGGIYGDIFEPENPKIKNLDGVTNFYANIDLKDVQFKDLSAAFILLSFTIGYEICHIYNADGLKPKSILFVIDEFHTMAKFIDSNEVLYLKDQARKTGFIPLICIQSLKYLIPDSIKDDLKEAMFQGIGNIFFYSLDGSEDFSKLSVILQEPAPANDRIPTGKFKKIKEIEEFISDQAKKEEGKRCYPVGLIARDLSIHCLYVDLETEWLWQITTHAGGKQIRNKIIERFHCSKKEASKLLAKHWNAPIPTDTLPPRVIDELIYKIQSGEL
ncbi:MAG: hypothetical protein AB8G05_06895 [Oligoflexales bacterium]